VAAQVCARTEDNGVVLRLLSKIELLKSLNKGQMQTLASLLQPVGAVLAAARACVCRAAALRRELPAPGTAGCTAAGPAPARPSTY
jgi:uncharacterized protein YaaW (UPF0174 family)